MYGLSAPVTARSATSGSTSKKKLSWKPMNQAPADPSIHEFTSANQSIARAMVSPLGQWVAEGELEHLRRRITETRAPMAVSPATVMGPV